MIISQMYFRSLHINLYLWRRWARHGISGLTLDRDFHFNTACNVVSVLFIFVIFILRCSPFLSHGYITHLYVHTWTHTHTRTHVRWFLEHIEAYWCILMCISILTHIHAYWRILTHIDAYWRVAAHTSVLCGRVYCNHIWKPPGKNPGKDGELFCGHTGSLCRYRANRPYIKVSKMLFFK